MNETHQGLHPAFDYPTTHRGAKENCSAPDCVDTGIFTLPADWGIHCPHGHHIYRKDEAATEDERFPVGMFVTPWPCPEDGCTQQKAEQELEAEAQAALEDFHGSFDIWSGA